MSVIRVGFVFSLDKSWLGGVNYYKNLWIAIGQLPESGIRPVVFMGTDTDLNELQNLEVVRSKIFNRKSIHWFIWMISKRLFQKDLILERLLLKNKIVVLSHYNLLGKTKNIQTIGWIPDFQHTHMPHLFSKKELERRDKEFNKVCEDCTKVIVSSHAALADLIAFSKESGKKAEVLQFAIPLITDKLLALPSTSELEKKYKFSGKYFLLPNQFWIHKNHQVVIEALSRLKSRGISLQVLSTGNTYDPRSPEYFSSLMQRMSLGGISDNFKVLGIIPMKELYALMQNAVAVINPSLFEGWSTTVEEAKSLEKKIVLSDIPVHREQNPEKGEYFPPNDADLLAEKLNAIWSDKSDTTGTQHKQLNIQGISDRNKGVYAFAKQYQKIIFNLKGIKA